MRRGPMWTLLAAAAITLTACSSTSGSGSPSSSPPPPTSSSASSSAPPSSSVAPPTSRPPTTPHTTTPPPTSAAPDRAHVVLAGMSEAQIVGQLFMAGGTTTSVDDATSAAISQYHVGSIIMMGSQTVTPQSVAGVSAQLQQLSSGPKLFVSTDQEGGQVQRLQGPGFSSIPDGLDQGQLSPTTLQSDAQQWASQMHAAGVNLNLAPVMDTVPSPQAAQNNPPIGGLQREFGYDPQTVADHGTAFVRGFLAAGVATTIKHFPGLGRVTGNTDTTAGVTDTVTTSHDPYLAPFAAGVAAGTPFVMMSTAIYSQIDGSQPAAFSPTVIGLLRSQLHFTGVVISDDLGGAAQVANVPVGQRAVRFIAAGGDVALTVDATQIPTMTAAVLAQAQSDPAFGAKVRAAALTVLEAKARFGLL